MAQVDKLVVTNLSLLRRKYGARWTRVQAALRDLIKADAARGLATTIVGLDDGSMLRGHGVSPVTDAQDYRGYKEAIDALWKAYRPDYVMILGAVDVVPHQNLRNPVFQVDDDDDEIAWGDLPYACDAPYSRNPADFRAPSRVVGRLPDITNHGDTGYLVRLLSLAARYRRRPREQYQTYFGLSTESWKGSTSLSLKNLFGSDDSLDTSPARGKRWTTAALRARAHFINCHGATIDPFFYGENAAETRQPRALSALMLSRGRRVSEGTVVAAECCFGAELYDPDEARGRAGICNTYLYHGAYGFFGSSTIAYGPPDGNGSADLLCQYFLERVLRGASLGRATLEARQQFTRSASVLDPVDLKTLAQFSLLGDPSVHPVGRAPHALEHSRVWRRALGPVDGGEQGRKNRREWIVRYTLAAEEVIGATRHRSGAQPSAGVRAALEATAREAGVRRVQFSTHVVHDPVRRRIKSRLGERHVPASIYVATGSAPAGREGGSADDKRTVVLIATVERGRIVAMRRVDRR